MGEALKLFEPDGARRPYTPGLVNFVVSPETSREQLAAFIKGARRQLLIYDMRISDEAMIDLLIDRAEAGVDVRIIGKVIAPESGLLVRKYPGKRLHVRPIVRDGRQRSLAVRASEESSSTSGARSARLFMTKQSCGK